MSPTANTTRSVATIIRSSTRFGWRAKGLRTFFGSIGRQTMPGAGTVGGDVANKFDAGRADPLQFGGGQQRHPRRSSAWIK